MRYCRNCRKNVADEFKICPECGSETEESKEEMLFPKEEIANLKHELAFTKDDLNRNIKFLKDEIKSLRETNSGAIKELQRVHVLRFSVVMGFINAIVGLILGILMIPLIGLLASIPGIPSELKTLLSGGVLIIIFLVTVLSFIMGFIQAAIQAFVYNFAASVTGGIKITLSDAYVGSLPIEKSRTIPAKLDVNKLNAQKARISDMLTKLDERFVNKEINDQNYRELKAKYENQLKDIEKQIVDAELHK